MLNKIQARSPKKVKIARVGLGRTGTTSLDAALETLGYSPLRDDHIWQVTDLFGRLYNPENKLPFS